ncbi:MAG: hypothetical protein RIR92_344 [Pseudomonadota bacterium]
MAERPCQAVSVFVLMQKQALLRLFFCQMLCLLFVAEIVVTVFASSAGGADGRFQII